MRGPSVGLVVTAQDDAKNGAHLRAVGLSVRRLPEMQSRHCLGRTVEPCVEPRHVAGLIRLATARGWKPTSAGRPFVLRVGNADVFVAK